MMQQLKELKKEMVNTPEEILSRIEVYVRSVCENDHTGHDWLHILRVYNQAISLANEERADGFIVAMSALLHDVWDHKLGFSDAQREVCFRELCHTLSISLSVSQIASIIEIINSVSYKRGENKNAPVTLEAKIVQDADRLDALGAIGIARTFAFGGAHQRPIYNLESDGEDSLSHFYQKLLKLQDLMHTKTAREKAKELHAFMELYLKQFHKELGSH